MWEPREKEQLKGVPVTQLILGPLSLDLNTLSDDLEVRTQDVTQSHRSQRPHLDGLCVEKWELFEAQALSSPPGAV